MNFGQTVFSQLIEHLPHKEFQKCVTRYSGDYSLRSFSCWNQFLTMAGPRAFSSLVGTSLVQLGWTHTALNRFSRGLYIRETLIGVRTSNTGGYKLFQVFGPTLATITKNWLTSTNLGGIVMNGTVQRFWPLILLEYKKSAITFSQEAEPQVVLTPLFKGNIRYWYSPIQVSCFPHFSPEPGFLPPGFSTGWTRLQDFRCLTVGMSLTAVDRFQRRAQDGSS